MNLLIESLACRVDKHRASTVSAAAVDALRLSTLRSSMQADVSTTPVAAARRSSRVSTQNGFTLLEMLLVIFLMALVASTGLLLTEEVEDQAKYDDTKRRMEMIRKAIVGDPTRTVNGAPEISGFVADMGRLPGCLRELLEALDCNDPAGPLTLSSADVNSGLQAGWRGPYLSVMPDSDGSLSLRDGYGNDDGTVNFGWGFSNDGSSIRLQSVGANGLFDGATWVDDYPEGTTIAAVPALINEFDYRVSFLNWNNITIRLENVGSAAITLVPGSLRLVLSYSDDAQPDAIGMVDSVPLPAETLILPTAALSGSIAVTNGDTLTVPAGTTLTGTTLSFSANGKISFTGGDVSVTTVDSVTVPASSSLPSGSTVLTIGSDGIVTFPAGSTVTLTTSLAGMPDMYGQFSLILACNDAVNPAAVDGKRYDGDCARYGTDSTPVGYMPLNQPYVFSTTPRSTAVIPPSSLIWTIQ